MQRAQSKSGRPQGGVLTLALLAAAVVEAARLDLQGEPVRSLTEAGLSVAIALLGGAWLTRRGPASPGAAALLIGGLALAPLAAEGLLRAVFDLGAPGEAVLVSCVRNGMLAAAVLSARAELAHAALVLSLFVMVGASALTQQRWAYLLLAAYALVGVWQLMGAHWERLAEQFPSASRRRTPLRVRSGAVLAALGLGLGGGLFVRTQQPLLERWGLLPTSGGGRWTDPFGSQGIGDGDLLLAAREQASSFGPVESELFLDSPEPSLYDLFNETYGEARKKKKSERAIALSQQLPPGAHQHPRHNEQAGREFHTLRERPGRRTREVGDRPSPAVLYVNGRTPLHLAVARFDEFDGATWRTSAAAYAAPELRAKKIGERDWMLLDWPSSSAVLGPRELGAVKLIRLDSPRIPAPARLLGFSIDKVDQVSFFGWSEDGAPFLAGRERVPKLTVVALEWAPADHDRLRTHAWPAEPSADLAPRLATPDTEGCRLCRELAAGWASGQPRGWRQIEAIVAGLRLHARHDPAAVPPADCDDPLACFLRETRAGPDYQFASAAAVALRSQGYPTRVVSGFYARPERYERRSRHTPVLPEDVHFWTEVALDGGTWLPVEPTPGYRLPGQRVSWGERLAAVLGFLRTYAWPLGIAAAALIVVGCFWRDLLEGAFAAAAWCAGGSSPRRRLRWALWRLERRAWLAGRGRPAGATPLRWYRTVLREAPDETRTAVERLVEASQWALFAPPADGPERLSAAEAAGIARAALRACPWRRLRPPRTERSSPRRQPAALNLVGRGRPSHGGALAACGLLAPVLLALAGCGGGTAHTAADGAEEDPFHQHDHHAPEHKPADFGAGVAELRALYAEIDAALAAGRTVAGDEALEHAVEEAEEVARYLPEVAADSDLPEAPWGEVRALAQRLEAAYGALHDGRPLDWRSEGPRLKQAVQRLTAIEAEKTWIGEHAPREQREGMKDEG